MRKERGEEADEMLLRILRNKNRDVTDVATLVRKKERALKAGLLAQIEVFF